MANRAAPKIPMYTNRQRMAYEGCPCDTLAMPPGWVFDLIAEEKLAGLAKNPGRHIQDTETCSECHMKKSVSGTCFC